MHVEVALDTSDAGSGAAWATSHSSPRSRVGLVAAAAVRYP